MQPADRMRAKIAGLLRARDRALELGDRNLARSVSADLLRLGYRESPLETTVAPGPVESVAMPRRRGRPPKERTDGR